MNNRRGKNHKNANATQANAPAVTPNPTTTAVAAATINTTRSNFHCPPMPSMRVSAADDEEDGAPIIVAPNLAPSPLQTGDGALNSTPINPLATTPPNPLATTPTNSLATTLTNPLATTLVNPFAMTPSNPLATHDGEGTTIQMGFWTRLKAQRRGNIIENY
ncbi:hypothetical protein C8R48DRAFT_780811 [Suillus tomentosus]|nr:hypothetical protein C8R48DRAFT_780811 [Suillus tomentosus]